MLLRFRLALIATLLIAACAPPSPSATASDAAERSCRAAIAGKVGVPAAEVTILEVSAGETGIEARATVAGAKAPWACFADRTGAVRGVTYTGVYP